MTKRDLHQYIIKVNKNKERSIMDLNVDELRQELANLVDIIEDIDDNAAKASRIISNWRSGENK